jgi:hypothetical protein
MVWLAVLAIVAVATLLMRLVWRAAPPVARTCALHPSLRSFNYADGWMSGTYRGIAIRFSVFEGCDHSDDRPVPPASTISIVLNRPQFLWLTRRPPEETLALQEPPRGAPPPPHGPYRTGSPPPAPVPAAQRTLQRGHARTGDWGDRQVDPYWSVERAPADDVDPLLADPLMRSHLSTFYRLDGRTVTLRGGVLVLHLVGRDFSDAMVLTAGLDCAVGFAGVLGSRLPGFLTRDGANELAELNAHRAETVMRANYEFYAIVLAVSPAVLALARATNQLEGVLVGCLFITNAIASVFALSAVNERQKAGLKSMMVTRLLLVVKASWVAFALVTASNLTAGGCGRE